MEDQDQLLSLEMGLTPKVFADTIDNASKPYQVDAINNTLYNLQLEERSIDIQLTVLPPRIIAGLSLPVTKVDIRFQHHSAAQIEAYMERFMKYFHRGGG